MKEAVDLFLEKTPRGIDPEEIREHIAQIDGVLDVHHIHIWSMDGQNHDASMHIVTDADSRVIKEKVRRELLEHGIGHVTIELETSSEVCHEQHCHVEVVGRTGHCHHGHHHG